MKPKNWILIWRDSEQGTVIYCQDKKWRKNPNFGDYSECAKQYSSSAFALRSVRFSKGEYEAIQLGTSAAYYLGIGTSL